MEQPYLAACTIYRDAASYLAEWIEFHRLVGVERFFLYDNGSADDHRDVLAPYVDEGIAVVHDWPMPFIGHRGRGARCRARSSIASAPTGRTAAGSHSSTSTSSCSLRPARALPGCYATTRSTRRFA